MKFKVAVNKKLIWQTDFHFRLICTDSWSAVFDLELTYIALRGFEAIAIKFIWLHSLTYISKCVLLEKCHKRSLKFFFLAIKSLIWPKCPQPKLAGSKNLSNRTCNWSWDVATFPISAILVNQVKSYCKNMR